MDWFALYALFGLFLIKLFAICVLGTLVEIAVILITYRLKCIYIVNILYLTIQNDRILNSIQYCNWYLLPVDLQITVKFVILKAQNMPKLMAGTSEMNLMLFVNVRLVYVRLTQKY